MLTSRLLALFPLLAGVLAVPDPRRLWPPPDNNPPMPGYTVQDLEWEVEVFPGEFHNFTGTVESVHRQASQLNPQWAETLLKRQPTENSTVDARGTKPWGAWLRVSCQSKYGWKAGKSGPAKDGVNYLRGLAGQPKSRPGPGMCGRVSCSWDTAIWWCNDLRETRMLDSWARIADGAQEILNKCRSGDWVLGQAFNYDKFSVIVREDRVNC